MALVALATFAVGGMPVRARAEEPHAPLKLVLAPCDDAGGADLSCFEHRLEPHSARIHGYFEQHADLVMRDILTFNGPYTLERQRERDRLMLYGRTPGTFGSAAEGVAMFGAMVLGAAHLPGKAQMLFSNPAVHLGPAIFDNGGMGAGIGGRI